MPQPPVPPSSPRPGFSRRSFLKGASALAAAAGTAATASEASAAETSRRSTTEQLAGDELHSLTLQINGKATELEVETRTTLLDALRNGLDMTGTKKVCDRGACGGCTVVMDGETVNSCMTLALDAAGSDIQTIEGLAPDGELHPMQQAFVECDALQCGFCTPGMVMSAVTCVGNHDGKPSEEQMRADMAGNICRCGTYPRIFDAIRKVGGGGK